MKPHEWNCPCLTCQFIREEYARKAKPLLQDPEIIEGEDRDYCQHCGSRLHTQTLIEESPT